MKVIIADGSAIVRAIIEQKLKRYEGIKVIALVSNCKKAIISAKTEAPDIIICGNGEEPNNDKDSIRILTNEMHIPVILLTESSLPPLSKYVKTISKPGLKDYSQDFMNSLVDTMHNCLNILSDSESISHDDQKIFKILTIGASTGGPTAVSEVLSALGENFPLPIVYTQHVEIGADKNLVEWLQSVCKNINIKLAENGEIALPGTVYMAPADKHLIIDYLRPDGSPVLKLSDEEPERFLRPAVNKLFRSAAKFYRSNCLAILLTGMGADGAEGCKEICDKGGWTIVEDKSTCAVFGMPAAAIEIGGAKEVLPRNEIAKRILKLVINDSE